MLLTDKLYENILVNPKTKNCRLNSILIFSGYATAAMSSYYLEHLEREKIDDVKVDLIVGMTPREGLRESDHKGFVSLMNAFPKKFSCSYIMNDKIPVHSKLYVWCEDKNPKMAFAGSANYTQTALILRRQGELATDCDPKLGYRYFHSFDANTVYCNHAEVENHVTFYKGEAHRVGSVGRDYTEDFTGFSQIKVSFLTNKGTVGRRSGLNWGQRPEEGRDPNQAYIPLKAEVYQTNFFPKLKEHFTVLTDDNKVLICSRAQQNGKAIHAPHGNNRIGEYFRNRLSIPSGAEVTKQHLENHGRTDVTFFKLDEENYYMDFSV